MCYIQIMEKFSSVWVVHLLLCFFIGVTALEQMFISCQFLKIGSKVAKASAGCSKVSQRKNCKFPSTEICYWLGWATPLPGEICGNEGWMVGIPRSEKKYNQ